MGPRPDADRTTRLGTSAASPDGNRLAGGSDDGTVRLWDVATRRQLGAPLAVPASGPPDGNFVAAWKQFGQPSSVFVSKDDTIYVRRCKELVAGDANTIRLGAGPRCGMREQTGSWSAIECERYAGKGAINVNVPTGDAGIVERRVNAAHIINSFRHRGARGRDEQEQVRM